MSNEKPPKLLVFTLYVDDPGDTWTWEAYCSDFTDDSILDIARMLSLATAQFIEELLDRISASVRSSAEKRMEALHHDHHNL